MTTLSERGPDRRSWACQQLGLAVDADEEACRTAFFHKLREVDFKPTPPLQDAYTLLRGESLPPLSFGLELSLVHAEEGLRTALEEFTATFFDLAPPVRSKRWADLVRRSAWNPALSLRLEELKPGLAVDMSALKKDPWVSELAEMIGELFLLPPGRRAQRKQQMLAGLTGTKEYYQRAVATLKKDHPALGRLAPDLLGELKLTSDKPGPGPRRPRQEQPHGFRFTPLLLGESLALLVALILVAVFVRWFFLK